MGNGVAPGDDAIGAVRAMLDDALAADAGEGERIDALLAALTTLRRLRESVAEWEPELIARARADGASWVQIAPALGVASRQAAERRYLRLRPATVGESTREQRVQQQRDNRAGDRAVEAWARANSATLRQLAGQVSALDGLSARARASAARLHDALAQNDAANLLPPLAESGPLLGARHAALVERLADIVRHTERLRSQTIDQRRRRAR